MIQNHLETLHGKLTDPYMELAFNVVKNACWEAMGRNIAYGKLPVQERKLISIEAMNWIQSDWCAMMCEALGIDVHNLREKVLNKQLDFRGDQPSLFELCFEESK